MNQESIVSSIDQILLDQNLPIEDLLDDEQFQSYLQGEGKNKIAQYLITNPTKVEQLLKYVVTFDDLETNYKLAVKYPFLSSELFGLQIEELNNFLLAENEPFKYLDILFSILENKVIEPTTLGYFSKVAFGLIKQSPSNFWIYLNNRPALRINLLEHLDNQCVSQLIYCLIIFQTKNETLKFIEERKQLFRELIRRFESINDNDFLSSLTEIFNLVLEQISEVNLEENQKAQFVQILFEQENLLIFLKKLIEEENSTGQIYASQIIISLLKKEIEDINYTSIRALNSLINAQLQKILLIILSKNHNSNSFQSTFGQQIQTFGVKRSNMLKVFEILSSQPQNESFYQFLLQNDFFSELLDFFSQYPWNNQLHQSISNVYKNCLQQIDVLTFIVSSDKICHQLINLTQNQAPIFNKSIVAGYRGHLTIIINNIISQVQGQANLIQNFQNSEQWTQLQQNYVELNLQNNTPLLGISTQKRDLNDQSNPIIDDIDSAINKLKENFSEQLQIKE